MAGSTIRRDHLIAFRWRAHQLDRARGSGTLADTALLDTGSRTPARRGRGGRWPTAASRGIRGQTLAGIDEVS